MSTDAMALSEPVPGISPEIYSTRDFEQVARIVYEAAGIVLPQGKAMLVYSRLAPLVRSSGLVTFGRYIDLLGRDRDELERTVAALTTNHTFFYREAHHFEHFAQVTRPRIMARLERREAVRIWSAGCSSGEETWSLVMTLLGPDKGAGMKIAEGNVLVLASDIAPHAIERGEAAIYSEKDLAPVPEALRRCWTEGLKDGRQQLCDTARSIVRFRPLNLLGEWPMRGRFDAIFCRNVMIYFDTPTKELLVQRFADALLPGGFLYIGHSERVTGPATAMLELVGPTIYRRYEG